MIAENGWGGKSSPSQLETPNLLICVEKSEGTLGNADFRANKQITALVDNCGLIYI